jgi:mannose-6-phosphate isomerase-like protein (cupin superfamily)
VPSSEQRFLTTSLTEPASEPAPDGSEVKPLLRTARGSMIHFELAAGRTSAAVRHGTVDEIWYVVNGDGELWRRDVEGEQTVVLAPGVCVTVPAGTAFQFRSTGDEALAVVAVTMPPWPGPTEATVVDGPWSPSFWCPSF